MRICFITEGSYPFVIGGVSSWINLMMNCFPDYEFKVFAIGAREEERGQHLCKRPKNLTEIREVFLDSPIKQSIGWFQRKVVRSGRERKVLIDHFAGQYSDWPEIFTFVSRIKPDRLLDFFNSPDFFDIVRHIHAIHFRHAPFNDLLWTLRTMYLHQFFVLQAKLPAADIYHSAAAGFSGLVASKEAFLRGKPFMLTEHGIYTREREEEIIKSRNIKDYAKELWINYFRSMSICAYTFAHQITCQFERNRQIQISLGADDEKTMVIPNGMNPDEYSNPKYERLYGDDVVVGSVARIVPIKDIMTMVRAFETAKKKMPKLKLVVMGPDDEDKEYNAYVLDYVGKRKLEDVIFTGRVDYESRLAPLFSMDIVLLTSISEGQPFSLIEAMAASKPVISTDVGSCSQLIIGHDDSFGPAGLVTPVMDHVAIAEAILKLAEDVTLRQQMGEAGRKRVNKYYTVAYMTEKYGELYEDLTRLKMAWGRC